MKCPGQDSRAWGPEAIFEARCPECGGVIEFFKDESSRKCRKCGHKVLNPKMDFGCAAYCRYAAQCLGDDMSPELLAKRTDLLKDRVAAEVKKALGKDFRRIGRALKVVEYTGKLLRAENAEPAAATLAAYLSALAFDASSPAADGNERDSHDEVGSAGPGLDRRLPPNIAPLAASILDRTGAPPEVIRDVLSILDALRHGARGQSASFQCVADATRIAELEASHLKEAASPEMISQLLMELFTDSGRELARELFGQPG